MSAGWKTSDAQNHPLTNWLVGRRTGWPLTSVVQI